MKTNPAHDDHRSRLIVCLSVGVLVLALVILVALLVDDAAAVDGSGDSSGRCAPAVAGTVDPVTCLPYGSSGAAAASTNNSWSSPAAAQGPGPGPGRAEVPAAPKVPAAPAVKAPAPPPVRLRK